MRRHCSIIGGWKLLINFDFTSSCMSVSQTLIYIIGACSRKLYLWLDDHFRLVSLNLNRKSAVGVFISSTRIRRVLFSIATNYLTEFAVKVWGQTSIEPIRKLKTHLTARNWFGDKITENLRQTEIIKVFLNERNLFFACSLELLSQRNKLKARIVETNLVL